MENSKTYCFDVDGTICSTNCEYEDAKPFTGLVRFINNLYHSGNKIILYTSRGTNSGKNWFEFTESQVNSWGLKYHSLIMGKPQADVFIDDRATNVDTWCKKNNIIK